MNTQTEQQTFKQLEDYKENIFIPYYILAIGDDEREQFELTEYNLLKSRINDIYNNIDNYKGLHIEVWLESGSEYDTITVIQTEDYESDE